MYKIGLIEDNIYLLNNVSDYLTNFCNHKIVFAFQSFEAFASEIGDGSGTEIPDLILLDIKLPGKSGIDSIKQIRPVFPHAKILMFSSFAEKQYIVESLKNGANGFVFKSSKLSEINVAIMDTMQVGASISPVAALKLISHFNRAKSPELMDLLTKRELELVVLVKKGLSYKEMADKLFLSVHTVNYHLKKIYIKLEVSSKSELISKLFLPE